MEKYLEVAVGAAGRQVNSRKSGSGEHEIRFKGETDLVTEVDRQCEDIIVS